MIGQGLAQSFMCSFNFDKVLFSFSFACSFFGYTTSCTKQLQALLSRFGSNYLNANLHVFNNRYLMDCSLFIFMCIMIAILYYNNYEKINIT